MTGSLDQLRSRLPGLMLRDEQRLRRRLDRARSAKDPAQRDRQVAQLSREMDRADARVERRRRSLPPITYPDELPVSQAREEVAAAISANQVVVVAGETGSGKTTQLPKICLELGRGIRGLIGHTQPRRLAARTIAARISEELRTPLGATVGWKVRFTDDVSDDTLVKLMTDGVLLAEITRDRLLTPGVGRAHRASNRVGHQRCQDVADRAGDPVRRRSRYGTDLALKPAPQGATASDRADFAGFGESAQGAGRTSDGICIRLYTEADFEARPLFTDPEILRTNLASVILAMTAHRRCAVHPGPA